MENKTKNQNQIKFISTSINNRNKNQAYSLPKTIKKHNFPQQNLLNIIPIYQKKKSIRREYLKLKSLKKNNEEETIKEKEKNEEYRETQLKIYKNGRENKRVDEKIRKEGIKRLKEKKDEKEKKREKDIKREEKIKKGKEARMENINN